MAVDPITQGMKARLKEIETGEKAEAEDDVPEPADDGVAGQEEDDKDDYGPGDGQEPEFDEADPTQTPVKVDKTGRAHGKDGKFASKDSPKEAPAEASASDPTANAPKPVKAAVTEPPVQPAQAPDHWPAEDKALFAKATPDAQAFLLRRHKEMEADYTKKTQAVAPLQPYAPLEAKYAGYHRSIGASTAQVADSLLTTEYQLRTGTPEQRRQIVSNIARQYGVNLDPAQAGPVDPALQAAQPLIEQQIAAAVAPLQANLAAFQQQRETDRIAQNGQAIEAFKATKNPDGTAKYPHFDAVVESMTQLMQANIATNLDDAYDKAVWSNPALRDASIAAKTAAATAEAAKKLRTTQKANIVKSNMPRPGPTKPAHVYAGKDPIKDGMYARLAERGEA